MNDLTEVKTVMVTGASSGIGEAICRLLARQGHRIIAVARNSQRLDQLKGELETDCCTLALDVTDAQKVATVIDQLPEAFREIGVLVNNAGHDVGGRRRFDEGSADQWCDIIETNVQGMIRMTHAIIDGMLARGQGHVVNMGSIAGIKSVATMAAYVSSKHAVHGLSETLRLDYAGQGIRVTEILPGLVRTGFAEQRLGDAAQADAFYEEQAVYLQPDDIARTVDYAIHQPAHVEISQMVVLPVS